MELQSPLDLVTCFLFLTFLFEIVKEWKRSKKPNPSHKLPPGPWKLPFIGNLHQLRGSIPHRTLRDLARKHGPLIHLQLGENSAIVVSSPPMAKKIMKTHDYAISSRPEIVALKVVSYNRLDFAFNSYSDYWRQMRKICVQELLNPKNVRAFRSVRQDEFSGLIASIKLLEGKPVNLSQKILSSTGSVVSKTAFGKVCRNHEKFAELVKEVFHYAGGFDLADLFPSFKILHVFNWTERAVLKIRDKIDLILDDIINEHIKNRERTGKGNGDSAQEDVIDVLLRVKDSGGLGIPIGHDNIKAILFDIFAGGTETSSSTVEWAMSELLRNPDAMAKAQTEIREACKGKKTVYENDIQGFSYLKLVIKETLRLHPPGPLLVPRQCQEDFQIDGYHIPIGTKVFINAWAIGRDTEYWPDAESFIPERFMENPIDFMGNHFEFIPFGSGRRMCPGVSYGLANIELPLALLLFHFNWKLPAGLKSDELDMTEEGGLSAGRKSSLCLVATSYDSSLDM